MCQCSQNISFWQYKCDILERVLRTRNWTSYYSPKMWDFSLCLLSDLGIKSLDSEATIVIGSSTKQGTFLNLTPNDWVHPLPLTSGQQTLLWHRSSCKGLTMQKPHHRTRLRVVVLYPMLYCAWHIFCIMWVFFVPFFFLSFFKAWLPCWWCRYTMCLLWQWKQLNNFPLLPPAQLFTLFLLVVLTVCIWVGQARTEK